LWQAGPAPIWFPIVGRLKNDELRHRGKIYPMTQHGFARDREFEWSERESRSCTLVLTDDAATRSKFPFAFRLAVTYVLEEAQLDLSFEITNTGEEALPASIGARPAFNWPLLQGLAKDAYKICFSSEERKSSRRLKDGLLRATPEPTPIRGKILALSEQLFEMMRSFWIGLRARQYVTRRKVALRLRFPGKDFENSDFGRNLVARRSSALNPGMGSLARRTLTANLSINPV